MKLFFNSITVLLFLFGFNVNAQDITLSFGTETQFTELASGSKAKGKKINWINVNTDPDTWRKERDLLICGG